MINGQSHEFDYKEESSASVQTWGEMRGLMNSFIADVSTSLAENVQLNYGVEITYSQEKQSFDYEQRNISTGLQETGSERRQVLNAEYVNLYYHVGKWNFNAGLCYEYTDLSYYDNGMKSESQSRSNNDLFLNLNISLSPIEMMNVSLGVYWRNYIKLKRQKCVLCVDRMVLKGVPYAIIYVMQSERRGLSLCYKFDVTQFSSLQSLSYSMDHFSKLSDIILDGNQ